MGKTILNNLNNKIKSLIKRSRESQTNNTNDILNKYIIKKALNKIISEIDDNACINKI